MFGLKKTKVVEAIPIPLYPLEVIRMKVTNVIQKDYDNFMTRLTVIAGQSKCTTSDLMKLLSLWRKLGESVGNKCRAEESLPNFCVDLLDVIVKISPFISFEKK